MEIITGWEYNWCLEANTHSHKPWIDFVGSRVSLFSFFYIHIYMWTRPQQNTQLMIWYSSVTEQNYPKVIITWNTLCSFIHINRFFKKKKTNNHILTKIYFSTLYILVWWNILLRHIVFPSLENNEAIIGVEGKTEEKKYGTKNNYEKKKIEKIIM